MSLATSVCRWAGGAMVDAERRIRSASPNFGETGSVVGIAESLETCRPLPYATGPTMGSISTRNALNSGVCEFASPTGGVSEFIGEAFLVSPIKPKCSGRPIGVDGLAVDLERLKPLGDDGLGLHLAAVGPDADQLSGSNAFLLCKLLRQFHEGFGLQDRVHMDVLGPEVEVLRQTVGRRDDREFGRRRRKSPCRC